jgi:EAL domain-containing protein (putative c-di-GMP-specific phosphodiesterase class I)
VQGESAEIMLSRLGQSLTRVMEGTGRRLAWADGETTRSGRSASQLETDLLAAIDGDEIEIVFQPQFDCRTERLSGAEALARWNHPVVGRIGAAALFAVAERTDHVEQLSRHIAGRSMALASCWPEALRLSLNIVPNELSLPGFADELLALIGACGFRPDRLTLEVTEQVLVGDLALAAATFRQLDHHGVRIALDDFGAGFCNFRYLKMLPLHYLKLDRSMVDDIAHDQRDLAVLRAILAMGKALGLRTIAEGIESEDQRALVAAEGCDFYQGFLRAAPMGAAQFLELAGG